MGEEVGVAPLSAEAQEILEWLEQVLEVSPQEAVEAALREGMKRRREAQRQRGEVIPFRRPGKA